MRLVTVTVAWLLAVLPAAAASAPLLDTLLAQVDARTVAASDIALARALGVFGFTASRSGPIERGDVERFIDALLMLEEAGRIGIAVEPSETERAWAAVLSRAGGEAAVERWLQTHAIDRAWARRLVEADALRSRFLDARFAAFVFVGEDEIAALLGPGRHDEAAREQARQRLTRAAAERAQAEWLAAARRRAAIRIVLPEGGSIAPPFPPP